MKLNPQIKGNIMLLLTSLIWGCAFVAQRAGMEYIGPLTFNGIRSIIGATVLIPVILVLSKAKKQSAKKEQPGNSDEKEAGQRGKDLILGGLACGSCLFAATTLQQYGMIETSAGKAGFITAFYIVLVPILNVFLGKKLRKVLWVCVVMAMYGLYLLCMTDDFTIAKGDILILASAFVFAVHILVVDYFSQRADGVKLSCLQFLFCGVVSLAGMVLFETVNWTDIVHSAVPILYAGVLSCGGAYTLQIIAQKDTEPTVASLLMSLESVFAVLAGVIILKEKISLREAAGCIILFAAIILAQVPIKSLINKRKNSLFI